MSAVLVTGATGFIGQHLVPRLLRAGHEVVLLLRESYGGERPLPPRLAALRSEFAVVHADLRNYAQTARAVRQAAPRQVLHLAAVGATEPFLALNTALRHNLHGTLHLLRACFETRHDVDRLVLCRTPGELTAMNVYAASKAATWQFCKLYARTQRWPIIGAMIFQTYGLGQPEHALVPAACAAAARGADLPMTSGAQERDFIFVTDVVEGLLATLRAGAQLAPGTTVDLGSGQSRPVLSVVQTLYALAGRGGQPLVGVLPNRPGEAPHQAADATRTRQLTGWQAATTIEDGLRATLEDFLRPQPQTDGLTATKKGRPVADGPSARSV